MSIRRTSFVTFSFLFVCVCALQARGQQTRPYPAFTIMTEVTDYDAKGRSFPALTEMRYFSGSGDWHYVGTYSGGQVIETIYREGRGVYFPDRKNGRMIKVGEVCNGQPRVESVTALRANPKFIRTEIVLGYTAYVHRELIAGYVMETYFVPQFGHIPFKRVTTFQNGYKRVEEPLSVTLGEPGESQIKGIDYLVIEQGFTWSGRDLRGQVQSKPELIYPQEARALGIRGFVTLQVIVDKTGNVMAARVVSLPLPLLDEAAMNAAYQTQFTPAEAGGRPIMTSGTITYRFNY